MSEVKHFHKKEAARILIELRNKTEDGRLMDYRRQLLQHDGSQRDENQNVNEFQERLEQSLWPWAYPGPTLAPYNPNVMPFGYPCVSNPRLWFPSTACIEPSPVRYNLAPSFQGLDFQHNLPWLPLSQYQGFIDPVNVSRRRRTKFTNEQLTILEKTFTHGSKFPSPGERMLLETRTGLNKEKISVWFQNRRAKEKREKGQEGTSKETEESTTESEENETEDELRVCDETPEEETDEIENRNQSNQEIRKACDDEKRTVATQVVSYDKMKHIVGTKRLHAAQDLSQSFEASKENANILYPENKPKENYMVETSSDDNEPDISNTYDVKKNDVIKTSGNVVDVDEQYDKSKIHVDDSRSQNKRRKFIQAGEGMSNHPGMSIQSYACLDYRLFGES